MPCIKIKLEQFANGDITCQQVVDAIIADEDITVNGEIHCKFTRDTAGKPVKALLCFGKGVISPDDLKKARDLILQNPDVPIAVDFPKDDVEDFEAYATATDFDGDTVPMTKGNASIRYQQFAGGDGSQFDVNTDVSEAKSGDKAIRLRHRGDPNELQSGANWRADTDGLMIFPMASLGLTSISDFTLEFDARISPTRDGNAVSLGDLRNVGGIQLISNYTGGPAKMNLNWDGSSDPKFTLAMTNAISGTQSTTTSNTTWVHVKLSVSGATGAFSMEVDDGSNVYSLSDTLGFAPDILDLRLDIRSTQFDSAQGVNDEVRPVMIDNVSILVNDGDLL